MKLLSIIWGIISYICGSAICIAFMVSCNKNLEKDDIAAIKFLEKKNKA